MDLFCAKSSVLFGNVLSVVDVIQSQMEVGVLNDDQAEKTGQRKDQIGGHVAPGAVSYTHLTLPTTVPV